MPGSSAPGDAPAGPVRAGRIALGIAFGALGLSVGLGVAVSHTSAPTGLDVDLFNTLAGLRARPWLRAALVLDAVGGGWFSVVSIVVAGILLLRRRQRAAGYWALTLLAAFAATEALRALFDRARPADMAIPVQTHSYPSGHVSNAAAAAVALGLLLCRAWAWGLAALWSAAMMLSRMLLGVHWISDVIGGALLGAAVAVFTWLALGGAKGWLRLLPPRRARSH